MRLFCIKILKIATKESKFVSQIKTMYTKLGFSGDDKNIIDLRSDTVTKPCDEMRKLMGNAIVGDDVYGEDRTVNELERKCAKYFGKEASLFVTSGTLANLLAVMAHCPPGSEIIVGNHQHIHKWEQGNYARYGGISAAVITNNPDGTMDLDKIKNAIRDSTDIHSPITRLICVENTHNFAGGIAIPKSYFTEVKKIANEHNIPVHLDGARIFNAAVKLNLTPKELVEDVDSLMMCFSKGLGAPIGSILIGNKDFIERARRLRKGLGGGWRQAGHIAAAALYAFEIGIETVKKDHQRVEYLISKFQEISNKYKIGDKIRVQDTSATNMILLVCEKPFTPEQVITHFEKNNILAMEFDSKRIRMIIHRNINDEAIQHIINCFETFVSTF
uniref:Beta_elim_lyase domain-containing protein n=1 Tax=Parastrongyloides trichosuri TaxID=131310 RepID=A0A0N5A0G1_PARTI